MATSESRSCSHRASWMFTDPYTYQYSDIDVDNDSPDTPPAELIGTAISMPCELEGSSPTDTLRYELPASPSSPLPVDQPNTYAIDEPFKIPSGLSRSRPSSTRSSVLYSDKRDLFRSLSVHKVTAALSRPTQPANSGLIPVLEDTPLHTQHYYAPPPAAPTGLVRPSPPGYGDGLIPVDPIAKTPKEPSSDFDAILRNIGPIQKRGKGNKSRERSNRYYDRYSSNFG